MYLSNYFSSFLAFGPTPSLWFWTEWIIITINPPSPLSTTTGRGGGGHRGLFGSLGKGSCCSSLVLFFFFFLFVCFLYFLFLRPFPPPPPISENAHTLSLAPQTISYFITTHWTNEQKSHNFHLSAWPANQRAGLRNLLTNGNSPDWCTFSVWLGHKKGGNGWTSVPLESKEKKSASYKN